MLGQHWQMAQAAEPKQLKREILSERISVQQRFLAYKLKCTLSSRQHLMNNFSINLCSAYHAAVLPREMIAPIVDH